MLPPVGFFIVRDQRLLTTDARVFRDADRVDGPSIDTTWKALAAAMRARRTDLANGVLQAPMPEPDVKDASDAIVDGLLTLQPPCGYCELHTLCGRAFGAVA